MTTNSVTMNIDGRLARIELARPEKLNALNDDVRRELASALHELEERPDVAILVLSGRGRAFSAGADLTTTAYPPLDSDWATRRHQTGTWQRILEQIGRLPQVCVVALHGHVVGGAALLAAAFDFRVVADDTVLRIPELMLGIPLTWGGIPLLAREVGLSFARDWVMTGRPVDAEELRRSGFAHQVAPRGGLDTALDAWIDRLKAVPPGPLAMTRAMFAAIGRSAPGMVAGWGDADHQQWSFTEAEQQEAVRAYLRSLKG